MWSASAQTRRISGQHVTELAVEPQLVQMDGRAGFPAHAPSDRLIVTASTEGVCRAWLEQLAPGGRLVAQREQGGLRLQGRLRFPGAFMLLRRESGSAAGCCGGWRSSRGG